MAKIITISKNKYGATFNKRNLNIDTSAELKAIDTTTGEIIEGAELRSIKRLVEWHVKSKKQTNELPTLWTVRP